MAGSVYLLCAFTSVFCAGLLVRGYLRSRSKLLLYSAVCFVGLAANNALLVVDLLVAPDIDLSTWRLVPAVVGLGVLAVGLAWEAE